MGRMIIPMLCNLRLLRSWRNCRRHECCGSDGFISTELKWKFAEKTVKLANVDKDNLHFKKLAMLCLHMCTQMKYM